MRRISYLIPALVVILVLALSSVFIVDERNKALVLQFGRVVAIKEEPGLSSKCPSSKMWYTMKTEYSVA